jgi:RNA polymerase sigma-70 factor (ECF subfamily)
MASACPRIGLWPASDYFPPIDGYPNVSLSEVDRQLLQRCLDGSNRAWQDFVDRFLGLVVHVANHTAESRNVKLDASARDDLVAEVFLAILQKDMGTLRRFRRNCSLATYLTVVSRRVIVRRLLQEHRNSHRNLTEKDGAMAGEHARIQEVQSVAQLLLRLDPQEANVVRMFHLEGKSYSEISRVVGMSENSIGPMLSRARAKMRQGESS